MCYMTPKHDFTCICTSKTHRRCLYADVLWIFKKWYFNIKQSWKQICTRQTEKQTGKGQHHEGGYEADRGHSLMSTLSLGWRGTKGDQVTGQKSKTELRAVIYTRVWVTSEISLCLDALSCSSQLINTCSNRELDGNVWYPLLWEHAVSVCVYLDRFLARAFVVFRLLVFFAALRKVWVVGETAEKRRYHGNCVHLLL